MKFATIRSTSKALQRSVEKNQGWWVQFGDELFLYAANGKWNSVIGRTEAAARVNTQPDGDARKGDMYLVIQKGRIFQNENPDVRVLFNKGRYLIVELPKGKAKQLSKRSDPCFRLEPLTENSTVFTSTRGRESQSPVDDSAVNVQKALEMTTFEEALDYFTGLPTRHSNSPHYLAATEWAHSHLTAWGYDSNIVPFDFRGGSCSNVVARKDGTGEEQKDLVVVAHLDSINHPDGAAAPAPGADDNASGSAGLMALAHALSGFSTHHNLVFILFGGEEQGLFGSKAYVRSLSELDRRNILCVLNMDMIGSVNTQPHAVLVEGRQISQPLFDGLSTAAAQFTDLSLQISRNPFGSDHMPFLDAGIPAALTIEGADSANDTIHTKNDTRENIDIEYAGKILRMNLGYIASEVKLKTGMVDCGCAPLEGKDLETAEAQNLLVGHYQALFAQYARLRASGRAHPQDIANWWTARQAHDTLKSAKLSSADNV